MSGPNHAVDALGALSWGWSGILRCYARPRGRRSVRGAHPAYSPGSSPEREAAEDHHPVVAFLGEEVVGTASLWITDGLGQMHVPDGPWRKAEAGIGYMIDPAHAGRGYATEIASALLSLAFDDLGVHRVTAGCFADNVASWRVMEKLGMRREQHGVRDSWHAERGWIDGFTHAMLAEEWRARQAR